MHQSSSAEIVHSLRGHETNLAFYLRALCNPSYLPQALADSNLGNGVMVGRGEFENSLQCVV